MNIKDEKGFIGIGTTLFFPDNARNTAPIGGIDAFTKLMLHMDGADSGTVFTDSEITPKAVTANGGAVTTTLNPHFSQTGLFVSATNSYLSIPDSADWVLGSGDFTIEAWVYPTAVGGTYIMGQTVDASNFQAFYIQPNATTFSWACQVSAVAVFNVETTTASLQVNQWQHLAITVASGVARLFLNGASQTLSTNLVGTLPDFAAQLVIGAFASTGSFYGGQMDEVRWSKGIARWTANFTPPTGPYTL